MQEVFAGFVAHTDDQVGRLVAVLDELDIADDTLVILIVGDNGPSAEGGFTDTVANILPHLEHLVAQHHPAIP